MKDGLECDDASMVKMVKMIGRSVLDNQCDFDGNSVIVIVM